MLNTVKSILVAIDPGFASQMAFRQALQLAASMQATVEAVSVTPRYEGNMHRWKLEDANDQLDLPFKNCLNNVIQCAAYLGQKVKTVHRVGEPAEVITALAEE